MLKESLTKALSQQLNAEFYSAYLYLAMTAYFEFSNLPGHAHWTRLQAQEEMAHGLQFFDFINARGGKVTFLPIELPQQEWKSPQDVFEHILEHETKVTALINELVDIATKEKDHATTNFLQKFVDEQVEEEMSANAIVQKQKLIGGDGPGLFLIDQELGKRIVKPLQGA
jgi:ferritin